MTFARFRACLRWISRVRRIITEPLPHLTPLERGMVKLLMCGLGHFVSPENEAMLRAVDHPVVFVFNHNNYLETLCVYVFLLFYCKGKKPCFLIDWMFAHVPLVGWFVRRSEPVYVFTKRARLGMIQKKKRRPDTDTLTRCLAAVAAGRSIGIFPEGKANTDPRALLRGRAGAGHLVLRSGLEVVPIGIDFKRRLERGKIPALGRMVIRVGARLRFSGCCPTGRMAGTPAAKLWRRRAAAVVDLLMRNLALLSGKTYPFPEPGNGSRLKVAYHIYR
jgi:1-acyl-sn-glycerol-3-phosphate acyltransferase